MDEVVVEESSSSCSSREVPQEDLSEFVHTHNIEDTDEELDEDDDRCESDALHYVPKRAIKIPSPVWECGGVKVDGGSKCNMCGKFFKSETSNTSNLIHHILKSHKNTASAKELESKLESKKKAAAEKKDIKKQALKRKHSQSSIRNFVKKATPIDPLKKRKLEEAVLEYMIVENQPLSLVDKPSFRKLMCVAEPSYICPSRKTVTRKFDDFAIEINTKLKTEVLVDLAGVEDKTVHLTSDHGTSHDRFRSHKNVLTLARCTKDFELKTDIVAVIKCIGSQTGKTIRTDVKKSLEEYGLSTDWNINWVTDGEAKQKNATASGKHPEVGMETNYTGCHSIFILINQFILILKVHA